MNSVLLNSIHLYGNITNLSRNGSPILFFPDSSCCSIMIYKDKDKVLQKTIPESLFG